MSILAELASEFSDFYKDAYGHRPHGVDVSNWTEDDFRKEFARLREVCDANAIAENEWHQRAIAAFEARIAKIIAIGAKDRAKAIEWLHDSEETGGDDEYLCFRLGLPYGYLRPVAA